MIYVLYLLVIVAIVGLDQITKYLVATFLSLHTPKTIIPNFFSLYYTKNTGIAFSMLEGKQNLLIVVTIIALLAFIYLLIFDKKKTKLETICLLMMLGGCIGNFIDRLSNGYVIDFFSFTFFGWDFAIFNIADIFLTVGAFLYIFMLIRSMINAKH